MKERDANRKYKMELSAALALYLIVLTGSIIFAKPMADGVARTLLLLSPTIPLLLAVWAIARHMRRLDEFMRLRSLESLSIAAAVTAALSFSYGFLEGAGFPRLSMFWVWSVMGAIWALHTWLRCVLSR
jgi:hypothetical protein